MGIKEKIMKWVHYRYKLTGSKFTKFDQFTWRLFLDVLPKLFSIFITYFLFKLLLINIILNKKGFEEMVAYGIIIAMIMPQFREILHKKVET